MKVSVIILNWNGKHLLDECLNSVLNQVFEDYEIIVVDNGSTDDSVEYLKIKYGSRINLIALEKNKGFAEGCNEGIKVAKGEYILLLNNDAKADKNWIKELVKAAEKNEKIGMCASKILDYYDEKKIDTLGHLIYPDGLNRGRGKFEIDYGQYDKEEEVFFPSGAAALYRKKMLDEVGFFDKDFFAYGDDTDIGLRARLAGWKCLYVPSAIVYHKSSASTDPYSPWKIYLVERNRIFILFKYFPLSYILISPYYTLIRFWYNLMSIFMKRGAVYQFGKNYSYLSLIKAIVKAYFVATLLLPRTLKKRREISKLKKITNKEFKGMLKKFYLSAKELALKE